MPITIPAAERVLRWIALRQAGSAFASWLLTAPQPSPDRSIGASRST